MDWHRGECLPTLEHHKNYGSYSSDRVIIFRYDDYGNHYAVDRLINRNEAVFWEKSGTHVDWWAELELPHD